VPTRWANSWKRCWNCWSTGKCWCPKYSHLCCHVYLFM